MVAIEYIVTFSLGGIITFIATELVRDRLNRLRNIESLKLAEFNKAASSFRNAFDDVLILLRKNFREDRKTVMLDQIITHDVLDRQDKARIQFEPFLDKSSLNGFNAAWDAYEKYKENYNINMPDDFSIRYISLKMIDHIYEILDYAQPKF